MLHIILFILMLIGLILASILGILLLTILIVLLVPIRYRIYAEKQDDFKLDGKVSWLLRLLYLRITYENNRFIIRFRILGKVFYDSENPKVKKTKRAKKERVKKKVKKEKDKTITKRLDNNDTKKNIIKSTELGKELNEKEKIVKEEIVHEKEIENSENEEKENHRSWKFLRKLQNIWEKIKGLFLKIKKAIQKFIHTISEIVRKWSKIRAFLRDEINQKGLKNSYQSLKKIWKHIRPRKVKAQLEFGTGDPCSTGQALGAIAVFYGYYGRNVQIIPNFETAILRGTIYCKGRIRLFTLLIICIKLIFNKEFRSLIENFKAFKEEL